MTKEEYRELYALIYAYGAEQAVRAAYVGRLDEFLIRTCRVYRPY